MSETSASEEARVRVYNTSDVHLVNQGETCAPGESVERPESVARAMSHQHCWALAEDEPEIPADDADTPGRRRGRRDVEQDQPAEESADTEPAPAGDEKE